MLWISERETTVKQRIKNMSAKLTNYIELQLPVHMRYIHMQ